MTRLRWMLGPALGLLAGLLLATLGACQKGPAAPALAAPLALPAESTAAPHTRSVTLNPDIAQVTLAVETRHRSLSQAVEENNRLAQQVMEALRQGGVAAEDLRTANFSVYQDRSRDPQGNLVLGPYQVTNQVVVTVRDLERLGQLLEAALQAGANRIDGLTFGAAEQQQALLQARLAAVEDAQTQAQAIAQAAGVRIVGIQSITFSGATPPPAPVYRAAMAEAQAVPVNPGTLTFQATVTIVYIIE